MTDLEPTLTDLVTTPFSDPRLEAQRQRWLQALDSPPRLAERRHNLYGWYSEPFRGCYGTVLTLYARLGAGSTWTKAGRYCRRCGRFWPTPEIAEQ